MKQKVIGITIGIVLVLAFVSTLFVWIMERVPMPICTYYLLVSADDSMQTSTLDFERGGSGKRYHGKSVLQSYPDLESAREVSTRLLSQGKETKIERLVCKSSLFSSVQERQKRKTISEVVSILYRLSENMEVGTITQAQVRGIVSDVKQVLKGCKDRKFADVIDEVETELTTEYYYVNQIRGSLVSLCIGLSEK